MAALFVSSVFILGIKLLNPTPIQIIVEGSNAAFNQIPGFFTFTDVVILIISSFILCASGMYLLFFDAVESNSVEKPVGKIVLEERKKEREEVSKTLKDDEQKIYKAILESDGIANQSELTEKTELSKSNVSRALDLLESKGLVERKRRGMGNIILLK